jgi:hypothetical protein
MSRDARKKEKHRLKRKEKQQRLRKLNARTALQRIAAEGGQLECWVSPENWKEQGIASIQVLGHAPGGRAAFAAFLVDLWAVGLKDAFGRSDVPALEFREDNLEPWIDRVGAVKMDPQTARRLIAGGVRFGRQNSFRMPPEWEKWVVIFGRDILDEIPTADLSDFGIEGGLRYVGSIEFLDRRLSIPTKEFLGRPDVHWVMGPDPGTTGPRSVGEFAGEEIEDQAWDQLEELRRAAETTAAKIAQDARAWCESHGAEPIPMLDEAARAIMFSMIPAIDAHMAGERPSDEDFQRSGHLGAMILAQHAPAERRILEESILRLRDCMTEMGKAMEASRELPAAADASPTDKPLDQPGLDPTT